MKPIIATHPNPHLDEICGIWLLKRYDKRLAHASVRFVPQSKKSIVKSGVVAVGIGRGKYDEHKGDVNECAASLVFKDIKTKIKNPVERAAVAELVSWVSDDDHARFMGAPFHEFMVGSVIMSLPHLPKTTSHASLSWGVTALDAILLTLIEKQVLLADWKKRKEFFTPWGKAIALKTSVSSGQVGEHAIREGFVVFVAVNTSNGYRYIKASPASKNVDLTRAYSAVTTKEPRADWYLHHSKRMLICGSDVAPHSKRSNMTLEELVALVKK